MAQSTAGTNIIANWAADYHTPCATVAVDWNRDGDYGDTYEDITSYVLAVTVAHNQLRHAAGGLHRQGEPATALVTCANPGGWFSPDNASGLRGTYAAVANGYYRFPIKFDYGYTDDAAGDEELRQFTGEIEDYNEWTTEDGSYIQFTCVDKSIAIGQDRRTTVVATEQRADQLVSAWLALGGITDVALNRSLSIIPYAWMDDDTILDAVNTVAAADVARFYFSKNGQARYERSTHWLEGTDHTTSQGTLTAGEAWWMQDAIAARDCYTDVIVPYTPMSEGPVEVVYQAARTIEIPPGTEITEKARFQRVCTALVTPVAGIDYDACSAGGKDLASDLTVAVAATAQQATVTLTNGNASHAIYVYGLQLRGLALVIDEAQEVTATTALSVIEGTKELALPGNDFVQLKEQASRLADRTLSMVERQRRLLGWRGEIVPWLELGDRVTIQNSGGSIDTDAYLLAMTMRYERDEISEMEVTAVPVDNWYAAASYFVVGTSNYAGTSDPAYY